MCSGTCTKCLGITLIPLAILCILANILLFFPGGEVVSDNEHISDEIWYFGGILGSGVLMLPALVFLTVKEIDCSICRASEGCAKNFSMCSSMLFAVIGFIGAGYCFVISIVAINNGPKCLTTDGWTYPFKNGEHLWDSSLWERCKEPLDIVQWHLTLFSVLLLMSGVQVVLCAIQAIDGFIKTICVTCQCFKCCESDESI